MLHDVLPYYCQPGRYYHNGQHIMRLLYAADEYVHVFKFSVEQTIALRHAIYWHDAVYHIPSTLHSNEQLSAELYAAFIDKVSYTHADYLDKNRTHIVCMAIRATEYFTREIPAEFDSPVSRALCDLDLIAFSDEYTEFERTQHLLDWESIYPLSVSRQKRVDWFRKLLAANDDIFRYQLAEHPVGANLRHQARQNMLKYVNKYDHVGDGA